MSADLKIALEMGRREYSVAALQQIYNYSGRRLIQVDMLSKQSDRISFNIRIEDELVALRKFAHADSTIFFRKNFILERQRAPANAKLMFCYQGLPVMYQRVENGDFYLAGDWDKILLREPEAEFVAPAPKIKQPRRLMDLS